MPLKEPAPDQLAAMHSRIVVLGLEPCAYFSCSHPYRRQKQKRLNHRSGCPQKDGSYVPVEILGPGSLAVWESCCDVYEVILLMLRYDPQDGDQRDVDP